MLPQFFRFVVFNNTGVTNTYNDGGIITLKHTGIYVAPSTGLLTYAGFTVDTMNFDTDRSMADGGEVYDDSSLCHSAEIDNSSSLYINTLVQLEVTHSLAATASGTFDIYLSTGTTTAELQTDVAYADGYADAETNKLHFVGSLTWPAGTTNDDLLISPTFTI